MTKPYIQLVMDLSTGHVPEKEAKGCPDFWGARTLETEFGWVVWPTRLDPEEWEAMEEDDQPPKWLRPILKLAYAEEVMMINFDRDGEVHPDLPTYEW